MIGKESYPVAILAGGLATRLRPTTETLPKALIPVEREPFIFHQLRALKQQHIDHVVLCVGYLGQQIEAQVGKGDAFGLSIDYVYDGDMLLGTAGAIKKTLPLLGQHFFVLYGDSYLLCNYQAVQAAFQHQHTHALMTVYANLDAWDISNVEYRDGTLIAYDKQQRTPNMQHIDYGLGVFSAKAFASVPDNQPYDLALLYQQLLREQQLSAFEVKQRFYEVGSFSGIEEFSTYIRSRRIP